MNDIQCNKTNCFYWAKGRCTSITALEAETCEQFRDKKQIHKITPPRRIDLTQIRQHLEQTFQPSTRLHPQTRLHALRQPHVQDHPTETILARYATC